MNNSKLTNTGDYIHNLLDNFITIFTNHDVILIGLLLLCTFYYMRYQDIN